MPANCSFKFLFDRAGAASRPPSNASELLAQAACLPWRLPGQAGDPAPSCCRMPFKMTRTCLRTSRLIPSRKKYEGYIPQTCSIPFFRTTRTTSSSSPLALSFPPSLAVSSQLPPHDILQRSEEWFSLRRDKLTTSTFSTALGFWKGDRRYELWHEKVFTPDTILLATAARNAMAWGVYHEPSAIEQYKSITGREVGTMGFAIHVKNQFGWLGASPDGLLGVHPDGGILEVKCPYNKGKPELGLPWKAMPYYYMPQVQGQMEIMDREWVDLYCWTPNGSVLFRVFRDRGYWELMHKVLREFWWGSVVPARAAVLAGRQEEANAFRPTVRHELTGEVIGWSRKLAVEARLLFRDIGGHLEFFR